MYIGRLLPSVGWLGTFKKKYGIVLQKGKDHKEIELMEKILYDWLIHQQLSNVNISGQMVRAKAEELSKACSPSTEYKFTIGWLDGFKKRHGIRFRSPDLSPSSSRSESDPLRSGPTLILPPPPPHLMDIPDQKPPPFLQYFPYK